MVFKAGSHINRPIDAKLYITVEGAIFKVLFSDVRVNIQILFIITYPSTFGINVEKESSGNQIKKMHRRTNKKWLAEIKASINR